MADNSSALQQGFLQYFAGDRCQKVFVSVQANQILLYADDPSKSFSPVAPIQSFDLAKTQLIESGDLKRPKSFGLSTANGIVEFACPTNSVRSAWLKVLTANSPSGAASLAAAASSSRRIPIPESSFRTPVPVTISQARPPLEAYRPGPAVNAAASSPYATPTASYPQPYAQSYAHPFVQPYATPFAQPNGFATSPMQTMAATSYLPPPPGTATGYLPQPVPIRKPGIIPAATGAVSSTIPSVAPASASAPLAMAATNPPARKERPKPKEPKELPKWVPGNYKTSRAYNPAAAPSKTAMRQPSASPQRARGGEYVESLRSNGRAASAPQPRSPGNTFYSQSSLLSQTAHGFAQSSYQHAAAPVPPMTAPAMPMPGLPAQTVDNITIGQLREALLSIPNHIRTSLIGDVASGYPTERESRSRHKDRGYREHDQERYRDGVEGEEESEMDQAQSKGHGHRHVRRSASASSNRRLREQDLNGSESEYSPRDSRQQYDALPGMSETNGLNSSRDQYSLDDPEETSAYESPSPPPLRSLSRQKSSTNNFVNGRTTDRSTSPAQTRRSAQRSASTPPSTLRPRSSQGQPSQLQRKQQSSQPPRGSSKFTDRDAVLEWSKKQAQSKRSNTARDGDANLKKRTLSLRGLSPQRNTLTGGELEHYRSRSATRGGGATGGADLRGNDSGNALSSLHRSDRRDRTPPAASKSSRTESFFDFMKSRKGTGEAAGQNPAPKPEPTRPSAPSAGSSVLLNSEFVRSNQDMLAGYRGAGRGLPHPANHPASGPLAHTAQLSSSGGGGGGGAAHGTPNGAFVTPQRDVKSSYEALKSRSSLLQLQTTAPARHPQNGQGPVPKPNLPTPSTVSRMIRPTTSNDSMTDQAEWQRFVQWLESIGMDHYCHEMREHGVTKLSIIELLSEDDLVQIGVASEDIPIIMRKVSDLTQRIRTFSEAAFGSDLPAVGQRKQPTPAVEVNLKTVKRDLLKSFDSGELEKFFSLWNALTALLTHKEQSLDFHLHLYFCVCAMKSNTSRGRIQHAKEALRNYLDSVHTAQVDPAEPTTDGSELNTGGNSNALSNAAANSGGGAGGDDLNAWMHRMTSSKEYATFAGLVFVPFPQMNPAFQALFKEEWSLTLRGKLEIYLDDSVATLSPPAPVATPLATPSAAKPTAMAKERAAEDITDVLLVKPAAMRHASLPVQAPVMTTLADPQPSLSTGEHDMLLLSPPANLHILTASGSERMLCGSPESHASSISQLTDDTPLKVTSRPAAQSSFGPVPAAARSSAQALKAMQSPPPSTPTSSTAAARKVSPARSALQSQVDNYNRLLKMNRLSVTSASATSAQGATSAAAGSTAQVLPPPPSASAAAVAGGGVAPLPPSAYVVPVPINTAQPQTKFNLGISRAVNMDQVNKYKAILQSKTQAQAAPAQPPAFRSLPAAEGPGQVDAQETAIPTTPALPTAALAAEEASDSPGPPPPPPPPPSSSSPPSPKGRERRPSELHNPDITATTLEHYLNDTDSHDAMETSQQVVEENLAPADEPPVVEASEQGTAVLQPSESPDKAMPLDSAQEEEQAEEKEEDRVVEVAASVEEKEEGRAVEVAASVEREEEAIAADLPAQEDVAEEQHHEQEQEQEGVAEEKAVEIEETQPGDEQDVPVAASAVLEEEGAEVVEEAETKVPSTATPAGKKTGKKAKKHKKK